MPNGQVEIIKTLEDHERRLSKLEHLLQTKVKSVTSKQTVKDFIQSKCPGDDLQKTLAIGYYLETYEDFEAFNATDLAKGFRDARVPPPGNINDKVNKLKKKDYLMNAGKKIDEKSAWVLTAEGQKFVEDGFQTKE